MADPEHGGGTEEDERGGHQEGGPERAMEADKAAVEHEDEEQDHGGAAENVEGEAGAFCHADDGGEPVSGKVYEAGG